MKKILAPRLEKGDTIGIIAPSNSVATRLDIFEAAVAAFEKRFDVKIRVGKHALGRHFYTSGTVAEKLADFNEMVLDPEIKGVIFAAGGDTMVDLVDKVDYQMIADHPKIYSGISDGTTLLNPITAQVGLVTFLGLEFLEFGKREMTYEADSIEKLWFGGNKEFVIAANPSWQDFYQTPSSYNKWRGLGTKKVTGSLSGGNYGSISMLLDTKYLIGVEDSIFLFETYKYSKNRIHRALAHLRLHGVFDKIAGLIVGYLVGSDDEGRLGNERDVMDLVKEVTEGYDFPVLHIGEFGHYVENFIMPLGAQATIDTKKLTFSIDEKVVI